VLNVRRAVRIELPRIYRCLGKINSWLVKAGKKCDEFGSARAEKEAPEGLFPLLRRFLQTTEPWLSLNIKTPFRPELLDLFFAVSGFLRVAEQYDQSYATCYQKMEKDLKLKLFCIDPAGPLKNALKRCRTAIFFSATMTPIDYFKTILGCREDADRLLLASPFPRENLGIFVSTRVSTYYRQRNHTRDQVARFLKTLIAQRKGNYLLFFPSYEYMQMVYELFRPESGEIEAMVQTPGMSESERDEFLAAFARNNPHALVGFAVMGGVFGEGIDLVGERLSGAAVVGVGLPAISLENELIREYFGAERRAGFEYAYLFPGMNRVLQAAGRVIRSEADRGSVLLIDQRYGTYRYKSLLPGHWQPIGVQNEQQLAEELQRFWNP
jgi:DNA excision repair protein ERCC-2